ncbi:MAG: anti-sigma factor family protein [Stellaceae bacterium]
MSKKGQPAMYRDTILSALVRLETVQPGVDVDDQIAAFLDGRTHGEELLHALYDHVLDEPIPPQMKALLRG